MKFECKRFAAAQMSELSASWTCFVLYSNKYYPKCNIGAKELEVSSIEEPTQKALPLVQLSIILHMLSLFVNLLLSQT